MASIIWTDGAKSIGSHLSLEREIVAPGDGFLARHLPHFGGALATSIAYYLLARLGVALGVPPDGMAVFWPPNAIILCTLLIVARRYWWLYIAGFVCAEVAGDVPVFTVLEAIGFGAVNCFEGALTALVIRRVFGDGFDLSSLRHLKYFVLVAVIGAPCLSALGGAAIYVIGGSEKDYLLLWRTWWLGDAIGLMALGPFILVVWRVLHDGVGSLRAPYWVELGLALVVLGGATGAAFELDQIFVRDHFRIFYVYPALVWVSLRSGVLGAAAAGVVVASVVSWEATSGEAVAGGLDGIVYLQEFLVVTILSTLTLAVLVQEATALNRKLGIEAERRRSEQQVLEAKEQAERASEAKTAFLAHMSHELRTPLNSVIGFSSLIKSEVFGPIANSRYREYVGHIEDSAKHLLSLINDVIDISRIERGFFELSEGRVRPRRIVADTTGMLEGFAASRNIEVWNLTPAGLPSLVCDEVRLRQVLLNLISNAVKFSFEGGRVEVSASYEGNSLRFTVCDFGEGIPEEKVGEVFERYRQFSKDPLVRAEGTGLGLYLSRLLVEAHDGRITLDSAPGRGTTVTLEFPPCRVVFE